MTEYIVGTGTGYRVFEVDGEVLRSIGKGEYAWRPGPNRARCTEVRHVKTRSVWVNDPNGPGIVKTKETVAGHGRIPDWQCSCGFYVLRGAWLAHDYAAALQMPFAEFDLVVAKVDIAGRAIEAESGYRAELAWIRTLVTENAERYAAVIDRYELDVTAPMRFIQGWITFRKGSSGRLRVLHEPKTIDFEVAADVNVPPPGSFVVVSYCGRNIVEFTVMEED